MILQLGLLILGLAVLIAGANWLVGGASDLARRYNVSDLVIGLTIVAFGTSAPELVVNLFATLTEHQDIVFGNILGSNSFNIFIVLGISGLIIPLRVQSSTVWKEIPISMGAVIIFYFMVNDYFFTENHILSRFDGIVLVILFLLFQYYVYLQIKSDQAVLSSSRKDIRVFKVVFLIILGLAALVAGGRLVVDNAVLIAKAAGISEKVIGLTIVAAGTSLPELATSVVAALRKNADIAVGNIIGSNIFNIFFIGGLVSLINPVKYNTAFNNDFYLLAAGTLILFITMFTLRRRTLDKWEAFLLLVIFAGYSFYLLSGEF